MAYAERKRLTAHAGVVVQSAAMADRPCLLVNPASYRVSRGNLLAKVKRLAQQYDAEVLLAQDLQQFHQVLEMLRARRQSRVLVLAGDGTAHAVAQYLSSHQRDGWDPELFFLGGGRANVVPRDGGGYPALRALRKAFEAARDQGTVSVEVTPMLKVEQDGGEARQGFLFVGAMLDSGVRLCSEHRARGQGWLHRSWVADPYCLLRIGFEVITGRSRLPPYPDLSVELAGTERMQAPMRLVIASTLALRNSLYRPFARRGAGAVRVTAVAAHAVKFWRRLPGILAGRFSPEMNPTTGYLSGHADVVTVRGLASYSLDGEPVECDPARPLRLSAGIRLRLLRL